MESEQAQPLTPQEAAQRLGVKTQTIYLYIRQGRLTARRIPCGLVWRLAIDPQTVELLKAAQEKNHAQ